MNSKLEFFYNDIPIGAENAISYDELCARWKKDKREVRRILHDLSLYDNLDDFVLIRSGQGKGFYKTNDENTLLAYKKECLQKGRSNFAPIKKINRILKGNAQALQESVFNNLKAVRVERGLSQTEVCFRLRQCGIAVDAPALSKLENGAFLPTPYILSKLAEIYGVEPFELVAVETSTLDIYAQI